MTGGASGALRQEFRELELLDEISNLHYLGKLHKSVIGDTHNHLIKCFQEWKGYQYVPQNVHKSICCTAVVGLFRGGVKITLAKFCILKSHFMVSQNLMIMPSIKMSL